MLSPDSKHISGVRASTTKLARIAVMLALALVLSIVDGMLPPLPSPVPLRYGLANVAVMATLVLLGGGEAFSVAMLKSVFVFLTRGLFAGLVSMSGTLCSILLMLAIEKGTRGRVSIFILSVVGAITHNFGQFLFLIFKDEYRASFVYVAPFLILFGILTGLLSAALLRMTMKPLEALFNRKIRPSS
jgi:heptaprenyl diphosphate synthase